MPEIQMQQQRGEIQFVTIHTPAGESSIAGDQIKGLQVKALMLAPGAQPTLVGMEIHMRDGTMMELYNASVIVARGTPSGIVAPSGGIAG